jgi:D-alanyl-D-alanine carboxypeptidase
MHFNLKKSAILGSLLLSAFAYSNIVFSNETESVPNEVAYFRIGESGPSVDAKAYAVFDLESGEVLVSKNIDTVLPIASVTKLFTATVVSKYNKPDEIVTVTNSDMAAEGGAGKLFAGQEYTYHELLFPLLLESSNDAAALFERVTGGEVVKQMNILAKDKGLPATFFADASGLSAKNVSSSRDLITFLLYINKNESHVLDITHLKKYVGPYTGWLNNSPVLAASYLGGKHGYTGEANRTLVALFLEDFSSKKRTIGYILLGSSDLRKDTRELRDFVATQVTYE